MADFLKRGSEPGDRFAMLISEIRRDKGRLSARFDFERQELSPLNGFIEGEEVVADASSLLLAAWLPAWVGGEHRIRLVGVVCPVLLANLEVVTSVLRGWFRDLPPPPVIECDRGVTLRPSGRRGAFLSGGVDSMSMVWERQNDIDVGVLIDYQGVSSPEESEARFQRRTAVCQALCGDIGIDLWTVRTNLRLLNPNMSFWMKRYFGSFLAAVAHGLNLREVLVASSYDATHLEPWGSHPLIEPNCSSAGLTVKHYGIHQSRMDKMRVLANWQLALDSMNVCTSKNSGGKNCGHCEKCLRTRLQIQALGLSSKAFDRTAVTVDELSDLTVSHNYSWQCYQDVMPLVDKPIADLLATKKPKPPGMAWSGAKYVRDVMRRHRILRF